MNPKEVLTDEQKLAFKQIPGVGDVEVFKHYTFSKQQIDAILLHRRDYNRLGFAVQLALVAYPGWPLQQYEFIPDEFIAYIAGQLKIAPGEFANYARREPTRREHLDEIRRLFGYSSFTKEHYDQLAQDMYAPLMLSEDPVQAVQACTDWLRARKIIFPALSTIERVVWETRHQIENDILRQLTERLSPAQLEQLDELLRTGSSPSLSWLRLGTDTYTADGFLRIAERLSSLQSLDLVVRTDGIPESRLQRMIAIADCYDATMFARLKPAKKYGLLALHLCQLRTDLTDRALLVHMTIIGRLMNEWRREQARLPRQERRETPDLRFMGEAKKRFKKRYFHLRKYAPVLLSLYAFEGGERAKTLLRAMDALRSMYEKGERHGVIDPSLIDCIEERWRPLVIDESGEVYRYLFETAVLAELRNLLRDGHLWVSGSVRFRPYESWKGAEACEQEAAAAVNAYLADRSEHLSACLAELPALPGRDAPYVHPHAQRPSRRQAYEAASLLGRLPDIRLHDLLAEVDAWTGFSDSCVHASTLKAPDDEEKQRIYDLLARLGTLNGLPSSQEDDRELATYRQRMTTLQWRLNADTLNAAQERLIAYQSGLQLSRAWDRGGETSYDAYPIGGEGQEIEGYLCRTINDRHMIVSTHLTFDHHLGWLLAGARSGKGLLDAQVRYCPTRGMADELFGLARTLGLRLMPRLRRSPRARMYRIGRMTLAPFARAGAIRTAKIEHATLEMRSISEAVEEGTLTAVLSYRKLQAYPKLREGVREIGRIEKTLYAAELMRSHERNQALAADEERWQMLHRLTRLLARGNEWHVRRDEREEQSLAILSQSLLINAIVVWNTVQLERLMGSSPVGEWRAIVPFYAEHVSI
ncbi:DUF4158 domain-containing protein [Paenibacillus sp. 598K]|uniref:DUF4158 domain-containing protein n=1 Tax=Paenibacillus sp. 598K TaxID=1117987 RepID=UPI001623B7DA|nr:DUF4158 domain-containing protein [Paenibacillus sp. 598K]